MYASLITLLVVLLHDAVSASPAPVQELEVASNTLGRRAPSLADIPFPMFPKRNPGNNNMGNGKNKGGQGGQGGQSGSNCPSTTNTNTQSNACSSGDAYCCSSDGNGGHICSNTTACTTTIICCNNNNGFQICIGDLNFATSVTINIYQK